MCKEPRDTTLRERAKNQNPFDGREDLFGPGWKETPVEERELKTKAMGSAREVKAMPGARKEIEACAG